MLLTTQTIGPALDALRLSDADLAKASPRDQVALLVLDEGPSVVSLVGLFPPLDWSVFDAVQDRVVKAIAEACRIDEDDLEIVFQTWSVEDFLDLRSSGSIRCV